MADLWFYTTDGKQMSPVPLAELQSLAENGTLKATDMVWTEGMVKWMRASTVRELYPTTAAAVEAHLAPTAVAGDSAPAAQAAAPAPTAVEEEPAKRSRRRSEDDDFRSSSRRRAAPGKASSTGIIVALFAGAVILVGALAVGVFLLITLSQAPAGKINPDNLIKGEVKYDVVTSPRNSHFLSQGSRLRVHREDAAARRGRGHRYSHP
jgi:hypothetical protein